ncbi:MAG: hypothetical protein R3Y11_07815 [Pseudomonadota bacterium]
MLHYWSNIFAMLGVALIATAFFRLEDWQLGTVYGAILIILGAFLQLFSKKGGQR